MDISRLLLPLLLSCCLSSAIWGDNTSGIRLTRTNIQQHATHFKITTDKNASAIRFRILVSRKDTSFTPKLNATLSIRRKDSQILLCTVAGQHSVDGVVYELAISEELLALSRLSFEELDFMERGLPGGDIYWLIMKDFAVPASNDKK